MKEDKRMDKYINQSFLAIFMIINVAKNASIKLKGIARYRMSKGNTPKFPTTNHININPINQASKVV